MAWYDDPTLVNPDALPMDEETGTTPALPVAPVAVRPSPFDEINRNLDQELLRMQKPSGLQAIPASVPVYSQAEWDAMNGTAAPAEEPSAGIGDAVSAVGGGLIKGLADIGPSFYGIANALTGGYLDEGRRNVQAGAQNLLADVTGNEAIRTRPEDIDPFAVARGRTQESINDVVASDEVQRRQNELQKKEGWDYFKGVVTDPLMLTEAISQSVPYMLPIMAPARAASAASLSKGMDAANKIANPIARGEAITAAKQAAEKVGTRTAIGMNFPISGGMSALETQQQVYENPDLPNTAEYQDLQQQGLGDQQIRDSLANKAGLTTGLVAGSLGTIASVLTRGGVEGQLARRMVDSSSQKIIDRVANEGFKALSKQALAGAVNEGVEEFLQSGSERFGVNVGLGQTGLNQDVFKNVLSDATLGLVLGGLTGGGFGTAGQMQQRAYDHWVKNPKDAAGIIELVGNPEVRSVLPDDSIKNLSVLGDFLAERNYGGNELTQALTDLKTEQTQREQESPEVKQARQSVVSSLQEQIPQQAIGSIEDGVAQGDIDVQRLSQISPVLGVYGHNLALQLRDTLKRTELPPPAAAPPSIDPITGAWTPTAGQGEGFADGVAEKLAQEADPTFVGNHAKPVAKQADLKVGDTVLYGGNTHDNLFEVAGTDTETGLIILRDPTNPDPAQREFTIPFGVESTGNIPLSRQSAERNPASADEVTVPESEGKAPVKTLLKVNRDSWNKAVQAESSRPVAGLFGWDVIKNTDPIRLDKLRKTLDGNKVAAAADESQRWGLAWEQRMETLEQDVATTNEVAARTGIDPVTLSETANQVRLNSPDRNLSYLNALKETTADLADAPKPATTAVEWVSRNPNAYKTQRDPAEIEAFLNSPQEVATRQQEDDLLARYEDLAANSINQEDARVLSNAVQQTKTDIADARSQRIMSAVGVVTPTATIPAALSAATPSIAPALPVSPGLSANVTQEAVKSAIPVTPPPAPVKVTVSNPFGGAPTVLDTSAGSGSELILQQMREKLAAQDAKRAATAARRAVPPAVPLLALPAPTAPAPVAPAAPLHPSLMTPGEIRAAYAETPVNPWEHSYPQWNRIERALGVAQPMTAAQHQQAVREAVRTNKPVAESVRKAAEPKPVKQAKQENPTETTNKPNKQTDAPVTNKEGKDSFETIIPDGKGSSVSPRSMTPEEAPINPGKEPTKGPVPDADTAASKGAPGFQGGKRFHIEKSLPNIRFGLRNVREKITKIYDFFGGGGGWGLALADRVAENAQELHLFELNPNRALKIQLFMGLNPDGTEREGGISGEKFIALANQLKSTIGSVSELINRMADEAKSENINQIDIDGNLSTQPIKVVDTKGKTKEVQPSWRLLSAGTLAIRLTGLIESIPLNEADTRAVLQAIIDQGNITRQTPSFSNATSNVMRGKNTEEQFLQRVNELFDNTVNIVANQIEGVQKNLARIRKTRPDFKVFVRQGNSFEVQPEQGAHVLSVYDPPYYGTAGYDGTSLVPIGIYEQVYQGLKGLHDAGNHVIYTDELWWGKKDLPPDMGGGEGTNPDRPSAYQIYDGIRSIIPLQWTTVKNRTELLGVYANEAGAAAINPRTGSDAKDGAGDSSSDGRDTGKPDPTGTRTTPDQTDSGVEGKPPAKSRTPDAGNAGVTTYPINTLTDNIITAIVKLGGIDKGRINDIAPDYPPTKLEGVGTNRLFSPNGKSLDALAEDLSQYGYPVFNDPSGKEPYIRGSFENGDSYAENALIIAIQDALAGKPVYAPEGMEQYAKDQQSRDYSDRQYERMHNHLNPGGGEAGWSYTTTANGRDWEVRVVPYDPTDPVDPLTKAVNKEKAKKPKNYIYTDHDIGNFRLYARSLTAQEKQKKLTLADKKWNTIETERTESDAQEKTLLDLPKIHATILKMANGNPVNISDSMFTPPFPDAKPTQETQQADPVEPIKDSDETAIPPADDAADYEVPFSRSAQKASGLTRVQFMPAIRKQLSELARFVEKNLKLGEQGKKGGLVLIDSDQTEDIAKVFAKKTGRSIDEAVKILNNEQGILNGLYDPRTGLTFAVLPNLSAETALPVVLHEAIHGIANAKLREALNNAAFDMVNRRGKMSGPMREYLDTVYARLSAAGALNDKREYPAYMTEVAVEMGRKNGFNAADGKFLDWVDTNISKSVGDFIRRMINLLRAAMFKAGVPLKLVNLTPDDLIYFAKAGVKAAAKGKVGTAETVFKREGKKNAIYKQYNRSHRQNLMDEAIRLISPNGTSELVQWLQSDIKAGALASSRNGTQVSTGTPRDTGRSIDLVAAGDYIPVVGRTVGAVQIDTYRTGIRKVTTPEQAAAVLLPISRKPQEHLVALVTDRQGKPLAIIQHTVGVSGESLVDDKILVGSAANIPNAAQIWFAHNHPSTDPVQSNSDYQVSVSLSNLLNGSGLANKGMIVLAANQHATWVDPETLDETSLPNAKVMGNKPVPVMGRQFILFEEGQTLLKQSEQTEFLKQFNDTGILLLDGDASPLAWVPMSKADMVKLRSGTEKAGSTRLMRVLEQTNADWALVKVDDVAKDEASIKNMMGFFNAVRVKNLDAQDIQGNTFNDNDKSLVFHSISPNRVDQDTQDQPLFSRKTDLLNAAKKAAVTAKNREIVYAEEFEYLEAQDVTIMPRKDGTKDIVRGRVARVKIDGNIYFMTPATDKAPHILLPNEEFEQNWQKTTDLRSFVALTGDKSSVVQSINTYLNKTFEKLGIADPVQYFDVFYDPFGGAMLYEMNLDVLRNAIFNSDKPVIISVSEKHEPKMFAVYKAIKENDQEVIGKIQRFLDEGEWSGDKDIDSILKEIKNRKSRNRQAKNGGFAELVKLLQRKNVTLNGIDMEQSYAAIEKAAMEGKKIFVPDDSNYGDLLHESPELAYEQVEDNPQNPQVLLDSKRKMYQAVRENDGMIVATNNQTPDLLNGLVNEFGDTMQAAGFMHFSQYSEDGSLAKENPEEYKFLANKRPEFLAIIDKRIDHERATEPKHQTLRGTNNPRRVRNGERVDDRRSAADREGRDDAGGTGLPTGSAATSTQQSESSKDSPENRAVSGSNDNTGADRVTKRRFSRTAMSDENPVLWRAGELGDIRSTGIFLSSNKDIAAQYQNTGKGGKTLNAYTLRDGLKIKETTSRWALVKELDKTWDKDKVLNRFINAMYKAGGKPIDGITPEQRLEAEAEKRIKNILSKQGYDGVRYLGSDGTDMAGEHQIFDSKSIRQLSDQELQDIQSQPKLLSRTAATGSPATETQAQAVLRSLVGTKEATALINSGRVVIHSNTLNLSDQERSDKIGAYIDEKGNIHLVLPFLSADMLNDLIDHESGHLSVMTGYTDGDLNKIKLVNMVLRFRGLRGLVGKPGFDDMIVQINRMADNGVESAVRARETVNQLIKNKKLTEEDRNHELLAYTLEYAPKNLPIYRRILAAIRAALYRVGIKVQLNDTDLVAMARGALKQRARAVMQYGDTYSSPGALAYAAKKKPTPTLTNSEKSASLIPLLYGESDQTYPPQMVRDAAQFLQQRTRDGNDGKIRKDTPEDNREIKRILRAEVRAALDKTGNAEDWYGTKIAEALNIVALLHPEIAEDPIKQGVFLYALAATSQGLSVERNIKLAEKVYNDYKTKGKFIPVGEGTSANTMVKQLSMFNRLVGQHGIERVVRFMFAKFGHKEIQTGVDGIKASISEMFADQEIFGSLLMGPKIGSFFQNLAGNLETFTIDMWVSRMWGRLTGDLILLPAEQEKAKNRFIASLTPNVRENMGLEEELPADINELLTIASTALGRYLNEGKNSFPETAEFEEAGKAARQFKVAANPKDSPKSAAKREWMNRIAIEVADELGIQPANLQAILWYPEKELYAKLGVRDNESAPTDYAAELSKLAKQRGISDADVRSAITAAGYVEGDDGQRGGLRRLADVYIRRGNKRLARQLNESDRSVAANKRFSRTQAKITDPKTPPTSGVSVSAIEKLIAPFRAQWKQSGLQVTAVQSVSDLPADLRKALVDDQIEGFYDAQTNGVYLIADNLNGQKRAQKVLNHEVVGHWAIQNLRSAPEFVQILRALRQLEKAGNKDIARIAQQVDASQPGLDATDRGSEIFAVAIEQGLHEKIGLLKTWATRLLQGFKAFLRKMGLDNNFVNSVTLNDVLLFARETQQKLNRGEVSQDGRWVFSGRQVAGSHAQESTEEFKRWSHGNPVISDATVDQNDIGYLVIEGEKITYNDIEEGTDPFASETATAAMERIFNAGSVQAALDAISNEYDNDFNDRDNDAVYRWIKKRANKIDFVNNKDSAKFSTGKPFVAKVFHGSKSGDIEYFNPNLLGGNTKAASAKKGFFFSGTPETPNAYFEDPKEGLDRHLSSGDIVWNFYFSPNGLKNIRNKTNTIEQLQKLDSQGNIPKYTSIVVYLSSSIKNKLSDNGWVGDVLGEVVITKTKSGWVDDAFGKEVHDDLVVAYDYSVKILKDRFDLFVKEYPWVFNETSPTVYPVYVRMDNPYVFDQRGSEYRETTYNDIIKKGKAKGHDGVVITNTFDGGPLDNIFVAFDNKQVKGYFNTGKYGVDEQRLSYSRPAPIDLNNPRVAKKTFDKIGQNIMDQNPDPMTWDRIWDIGRNNFNRGLALLNRQQLVEMSSRKIVGLGRALLPSAKFFENAAALMDGIKSRIKREMYDGLIEPWQREAGKNRKNAYAFDFILHGSTLHQVDPTQAMREQNELESDADYAKAVEWHGILSDKLKELAKMSPILADTVSRVFENYVKINDMKYAAMKERVGRSGFGMVRTMLERVRKMQPGNASVQEVADTLTILKAADQKDLRAVENLLKQVNRFKLEEVDPTKGGSFKISSPIVATDHNAMNAIKLKYQNFSKAQKKLFKARERLAKAPQAARLFEYQQRDADGYGNLVQLITSTQRRAINVLVDRVSQKSMVPEEHAAMQAELAKLPEDAQSLYNDIINSHTARQSDMMDKIELYQEASRGVKPYVPLSRFGKYEVFGEKMVAKKDEKGQPVIDDNGQPVMERQVSFSKFATIHEQKNAAKFLKAEGWTVSTDYQVIRDHVKTAPSGSFIGEMFGFIDDTVANDREKSALKDSLYNMYLENLPDMSVRKHLMKRAGIAGYNRDALRAYGQFMNGSANMIARLRYADVLTEQLFQMEEEVSELSNHENDQAKAGAILNELISSYDWLMNPSNATWANRMTALGFVWYLTNPSTALINLSQIPLLTFPELASKFGGGKAAGGIMRAMKDYFLVMNETRKMGWNPLNPPMALKATKQVQDENGQARDDVKYFTYTNETEYLKAIKQMETDGFTVDRAITPLEAAIMQTLGGEYKGDMGRFMEFLEKSGRVSRSATTQLAGLGEDSWQTQDNLKGKFSRLAGTTMKFGAFLFHHSEVANREITAIAAYRMMREKLKGLPEEQAHQQAQEYAYNAVTFTQGDYSNANRARFMRGDFMRVIALFRTFAQMMTWRLTRDFYQSIGGKGVDPVEKSQARARFGWMMLNIALLGGAMGLPMYTMIVNIVNALAPDDPDDPWDFELWMQQQLAALVGDAGRQAIMTGPAGMVPMLFGAKDGINLSPRLSLDIIRMWIRKPPGDLEGNDLVNNYLQQAAGPAFGLAFKAAQGAKDFKHGVAQGSSDMLFRSAESLLPAPLANVTKAWRFQTEGAQTRRGDKIIDDVSTGQLISQAFGFQPADLYEKYQQNDWINREKTGLERRKKDLINGLVYAIEEKDSEAQAEKREQIAQYNQKNPADRIKPTQIQNAIKQRRIRDRWSMNGMYIPNKGMRKRLEAERYLSDDEE